MLVCFGVSWPFSVAKSWTSRSTKGKSLFFLMMIELGYVAGITRKLIVGLDAASAFYALNFVLVLADILIYFRNRKLERAARDGA